MMMIDVVNHCSDWINHAVCRWSAGCLRSFRCVRGRSRHRL